MTSTRTRSESFAKPLEAHFRYLHFYRTHEINVFNSLIISTQSEFSRVNVAILDDQVIFILQQAQELLTICRNDRQSVVLLLKLRREHHDEIGLRHDRSNESRNRLEREQVRDIVPLLQAAQIEQDQVSVAEDKKPFFDSSFARDEPHSIVTSNQRS